VGIPGGIKSEIILIYAIFFASLSVSLSIFESKTFIICNKIFISLFISLLIGLYISNALFSPNIFAGQEKRDVVEITARVSDDSKEISGGQSIFPVEVLSAKGINSTLTSASGKLTVVSRINLFKGQTIVLSKRNILRKSSSIIFVDREKIKVLDWNSLVNIKILKKRAYILNYLKLKISRFGHGPDILFSALFTGKKENPKGELFTSLRKAGASHILALSGMHLGIIAFGFMFLFTPFFGKKISFYLTLLIILLYVSLVLSGPSLTRAVIFFTLLGFFSLSGARTDIFHILVICFLIQVTVDSNSAYELSFQLSYLALGGIILGSANINRILPGFIPPKLRGILSASVSAQLFTAPLVLYYFGVIYPVGVLSGIILVPIITTFIWVGIVGMFPLPWVIQSLVFTVMKNLYKLIETFSNFFSRFPVLNMRASVIFFIILFVVPVIVMSTRKYYTLAKARSLDGV